MFKITFHSESFLCPETMSVIEAAKVQNAKVPYGCIGGGCGICKMKIVEGQYKWIVMLKMLCQMKNKRMDMYSSVKPTL